VIYSHNAFYGKEWLSGSPLLSFEFGRGVADSQRTGRSGPVADLQGVGMER
jgi:hypothetical protein